MDLSSCEPVSHQGNTNEWFTPRWILDQCGKFDLDPCGDKRWETAKTIYETAGLEKDWFGRVWLNPPYGRHVGIWLNRLVKHGNGMALIFARTDTRWFQSFALHCDWILFIAGRVKFVSSTTLEEANKNPGAPSILCAIGKQDRPSIKGIFL